MLIELLRHGRTDYNDEKRYQGRSDPPLSARGRAELRRAEHSPAVVYVTPLRRTAETARVLFPQAELVAVDGLREMDFGQFEGKNYHEMEQDPAYRAWVASGCESPCPGGESRAAFCGRVCRAFVTLTDAALARGEQRLVIVAHGGTQMAVLERFALPRKTYYEWCAPLAGGFVLDASDWRTRRTLHVREMVRYTKEEL